MSSIPPIADITSSMTLSSTTQATSSVPGIAVGTLPSSTIQSSVTQSAHLTPSVAPPPVTQTQMLSQAVTNRQGTIRVNSTSVTNTNANVSASKPQKSGVLAGGTTKSVSSKSKKKSGATVTMATAATAQSTNGNGGTQGENTGRWTAEEHNLFLQGLELHGKGWKKIAGLIKSRTVVQIRTHAQKYFQKLAKAKQNGEDVGGSNVNGGAGVGNVMSAMSSNGGGRNGAGGNLQPSSNTQTNKRRKQTSGTKRKAIQSVVASARREGNKKLAMHKSAAHTLSSQYDRVTNDIGFGGCDITNNTLIPNIAPSLAPYVLPFDANATKRNSNCVQTTGSSSHGTILEDSLFRYLTPTPVAPLETPVNSVARQAGANPIMLPTASKTAQSLAGGEISPTGVTDLEFYPSWTDISKDTPSWYAKGSDVDALLDVADTLDWLADTGDLTETYEEAERMNTANNVVTTVYSSLQSTNKVQPSDVIPSQKETIQDSASIGTANPFYTSSNNITSMSTNTLPRIDSGAEVVVPPLPSLFDGGLTDNDPSGIKNRSPVLSSNPSVTNLVDENLFSSPIEESDFVSCIMNDTS